MSLLARPEGDEIARIYGRYFSKRDIASIQVGDKLDALCEDGLNYHVEVKERDTETNECLLHFIHWSRKFDYRGPINNLYLTTAGKFSTEAGITALNNYTFLIDKNDRISQKNASAKTDKTALSSATDLESQGATRYTTNTKYPEDFLARPRPRLSAMSSRRGKGRPLIIDSDSKGVGKDDGNEEHDNGEDMDVEIDGTELGDNEIDGDNEDEGVAFGAGNRLGRRSGLRRRSQSQTEHNDSITVSIADTIRSKRSRTSATSRGRQLEESYGKEFNDQSSVSLEGVEYEANNHVEVPKSLAATAVAAAAQQRWSSTDNTNPDQMFGGTSFPRSRKVNLAPTGNPPTLPQHVLLGAFMEAPNTHSQSKTAQNKTHPHQEQLLTPKLSSQSLPNPQVKTEAQVDSDSNVKSPSHNSPKGGNSSQLKSRINKSVTSLIEPATLIAENKDPFVGHDWLRKRFSSSLTTQSFNLVDVDNSTLRSNGNTNTNDNELFDEIDTVKSQAFNRITEESHSTSKITSNIHRSNSSPHSTQRNQLSTDTSRRSSPSLSGTSLFPTAGSGQGMGDSLGANIHNHSHALLSLNPLRTANTVSSLSTSTGLITSSKFTGSSGNSLVIMPSANPVTNLHSLTPISEPSSSTSLVSQSALAKADIRVRQFIQVLGSDCQTSLAATKLAIEMVERNPDQLSIAIEDILRSSVTSTKLSRQSPLPSTDADCTKPQAHSQVVVRGLTGQQWKDILTARKHLDELILTFLQPKS